jgi:tetratricopeptide (TPR) repeat protein
MSRKIWIGLAALVVVVLLVAGGFTAYFFTQRQRQHASWLTSAEAQRAAGDYHLAKASYGLYLANYPNDVAVLRDYVDAAREIETNRRRTLRQAAVGLNQMLKFLPTDDPDRARVTAELLDLYVATESWGDLQYFAQQQLSLNADDDRMVFHRALALFRQGRLDEAERTFKVLVDRGSQIAEAYGRVASSLMDRRLELQAQDVLDRGLEAMASDPEMRVVRANFFKNHLKPEQAEAELDLGLEVSPDHAGVLLSKAQFASGRREFGEAANLAERALALDESQAVAHSVLAHAYKRSGRLDEAIDLLNGMDPLLRIDTPSIPLALAEMLYGAGRLDEGDAVVERYLLAYPNHQAIRDYFAGRRLLLENNCESAIRQLSIVYDEQPSFAPAHFFLVAALLDCGRRSDARSTLEMYIRNQPQDDSARAIMAREFGRFEDPATLMDMAQAVLTNQNATAESLVMAALPMYDAAAMHASTDRAAALAVQMLEEAISRAPEMSGAYRGLADVHAAEGNLAAAEDVLDRGDAAGVDGDTFVFSRANLAYRRGELGRVGELINLDLAGERLDADRVSSWSSFLVGRSLFDLASSALRLGIEKAEAERRIGLEIELARVAIKDGAVDSALAQLDGLAASVADGAEEDRQALVMARMEGAEALMKGSASGDYGRARAIVEGIPEESRDTYYELVLVELLMAAANPDLAGAATALDSVLDRDNGNLRALMARAEVARLLGDLAGALRFAEEAALRAPALESAQLHLADIQVQMDSLPQARMTLERVLERKSTSVEAMLRLGDVYMRQLNRDKTSAMLRQLDEAVKDDVGAQLEVAALRGRFLQMSGEAGEAETMLLAMYARAPDDLELARNLAESVFRQGRKDEAIDILEAFASGHETNPDAWIALSRMYRKRAETQHYNKASTALTRALVIDPRNLRALREMVLTQISLGHYTDALAVADRLLVLRPDDADMMYHKALLLTRRPEEVDRALALVTDAIMRRDSGQYRFLRGVILLGTKAYTTALIDFEAVARSQRVTTAQLDLALAEAYWGVGDGDRARRFLESAVKKGNRGSRLDSARLQRVEALIQREAAAI